MLRPAWVLPPCPHCCEASQLSSSTLGTAQLGPSLCHCHRRPRFPRYLLTSTWGQMPGKRIQLTCCISADPSLTFPRAFCGKERKARVPAGSSNLLEAPAEMEPGVTPSCCPCAPHQAELAGSAGPSLPAQRQRLRFGHSAMLPGSGRTQLPALPALPARACTSSACLYPGALLGWSGGHLGRSSNRNENTKV